MRRAFAIHDSPVTIHESKPADFMSLTRLHVALLFLALPLHAAPQAARSVHLRWPAPAADIFYNELTVEQSVPGSYFMACGFRHGYFGMQELGDGRKIVLFSVWDPDLSSDPKALADKVPAENRAEVLHHDPDVVAKRFGGEGTGAQSMWDYPWKIGETCRFSVRATVEGQKTAFAAFFWLAAENRWKHLATFRTTTKGESLRDLYSFIEDFRRDGKSATEVRRARFTRGWARSMAGDWTALHRAMFTADDTPTDNIDAGFAEDGYFLATGGEIKNRTQLGMTFVREPVPVPRPLPPASWQGEAKTAAGEALATIAVDTSKAPDVAAWGAKAGELCAVWYPKIHELLKSDGFTPPKNVRLVFDPAMKGVAHTSGAAITISAAWVRAQPDDWGMVVHELTHVVQGYTGGEFWVTEAIAEYIRDGHFEPGVRKFEISEKSSYKEGYRIAGSFLRWLEEQKNPAIVATLNAALRRGAYQPAIFKEMCGAELDELWKEFASAYGRK